MNTEATQVNRMNRTNDQRGLSGSESARATNPKMDDAVFIAIEASIGHIQGRSNFPLQRHEILPAGVEDVGSLGEVLVVHPLLLGIDPSGLDGDGAPVIP